jgi:uncharacterized protein (TIRG00374 family)
VLTEKPHLGKWSALLALLGFVAFMVYLFFFTDFTDVQAMIVRTNIGVYVLAFVSVVMASVFDALAWKATLDGLSVKTRFRRIFSLSWVGHFIDTLIPGGLSGDVFKTYLLAKDQYVNGTRAVASMIIKNVLEVLVVLSSLVLGMILLALNYSVDSTVVTAVGITILLMATPLVLVVFLSVKASMTERLLRALKRVSTSIKGKQYDPVGLEATVHGQVAEFRQGLASIRRNPKVMIRPVVFQALSWLFEVLSLFAVFAALGSLVGIDKVVITNSIVSDVQGQGVALAGVSTIVSSAVYQALGINAGVAVASSLLAGFSGFWFKLVLSFGFFQVSVFERCVPFLCSKCSGRKFWGRKGCPETQLEKPKTVA